MRIVSCLSTPVRASEAYILTQAEALAAVGSEVTVVEARDPDGNPERRETPVHVLSLPLSPQRLPRSPLARLLRAMRTALTGSTSQLTGKDRRTWLDALKEIRPEIVLVQFGPSAVRLRPILNRLGCPWGVQFHGYDATLALGQWSYRRALGPTLRDAHFIFACSRFVAAQLEPFRGDTPLHVITPGTTIIGQPFRPRPPSAVLRLVCVSRLVPVKGHRQLLQALARVSAPIHLTLVGDGVLRSELESLAGQLGLDADRIAFLGQVTPDQVREALAAADAFIQCSTHTSDGAIEGLGLTAAEGALAGLPVIVTDSGGLAETCIDGETGLVVPDGDIDAIAAAIDRLAGMPELRIVMGRKGQAHARHFGHIAQAERALNVMQAVA